MSDKKFFDRTRNKGNFDDNPDVVFEFSGNSTNVYPPRRKPIRGEENVGWRAVATVTEETPNKKEDFTGTNRQTETKLFFDPSKVVQRSTNMEQNAKDLIIIFRFLI